MFNDRLLMLSVLVVIVKQVLNYIQRHVNVFKHCTFDLSYWILTINHFGCFSVRREIRQEPLVYFYLFVSEVKLCLCTHTQ